MKNRYFSHPGRAGFALLLATILAAGVIGPLQTVRAAQVRRAWFPPIHAKAGDTLLLSVVNTENQAIAVQFRLHRASDLSPLNESNPFTLPPRTGNYYPVTMPIDEYAIAAIDIVSPKDPASGLSIQASLQVRDATGRTVMFKDCTGPYGIVGQ